MSALLRRRKEAELKDVESIWKLWSWISTKELEKKWIELNRNWRRIDVDLLWRDEFFFRTGLHWHRRFRRRKPKERSSPAASLTLQDCLCPPTRWERDHKAFAYELLTASDLNTRHFYTFLTTFLIDFKKFTSFCNASRRFSLSWKILRLRRSEWDLRQKPQSLPEGERTVSRSRKGVSQHLKSEDLK